MEVKYLTVVPMVQDQQFVVALLINDQLIIIALPG